MTSKVESTISTGRRAGMWISLAVTTASGYRSSHHQLRPSTSMVSDGLVGGSESTWRAPSDTTNVPPRTTPDTPSPAMAMNGSPHRTVPWSTGPRSALRRRTATARKPITTATTTAEIQNINHHKPSTRPTAFDPGWRIEGASLELEQAAEAARPTRTGTSATRRRRREPGRGGEGHGGGGRHGGGGGGGGGGRHSTEAGGDPGQAGDGGCPRGRAEPGQDPAAHAHRRGHPGHSQHVMEARRPAQVFDQEAGAGRHRRQRRHLGPLGQ